MVLEGKAASKRRWASLAIAAAAAGALTSLASCKVLPIDQVRKIKERESGNFDVGRYAASAWQSVQRDLETRAVPLAELNRDRLDELGADWGNRAGEGSPWTFFVTGDGVVRSTAPDRPRGVIELDTMQGPVVLQVGPVVSGTAVRDALPTVTFNDVADQIAFAEVGLALTERALKPLADTINSVEPGDRVTFGGAASVPKGAGPLLVTPIRLARSQDQAK